MATKAEMTETIEFLTKQLERIEVLTAQLAEGEQAELTAEEEELLKHDSPETLAKARRAVALRAELAELEDSPPVAARTVTRIGEVTDQDDILTDKEREIVELEAQLEAKRAAINDLPTPATPVTRKVTRIPSEPVEIQRAEASCPRFTKVKAIKSFAKAGPKVLRAYLQGGQHYARLIRDGVSVKGVELRPPLHQPYITFATLLLSRLEADKAPVATPRKRGRPRKS